MRGRSLLIGLGVVTLATTFVRIAVRRGGTSDHQAFDVGFRCAKDAP